MRSPIIIAGVLALVCLSACTSLDVKVDVLRPSQVSEVTLDQELRRDAVRLVQNDTSERIVFIAAQKESYRAYRVDCFDRMIAEAGRVWPAQAVQIRGSLEDAKTSPDLLSEIDELFAPMAARLGDIDRQARNQAASLPQSDLAGRGAASPLSSDVKAALMARRTAYLETASAFYTERQNQCVEMVALLAAPLLPPAAAAPAAGAADGSSPSSTQAAQTLDAGVAGPALRAVTQTAAANAADSARRVITGGGVLLLAKPEAWAVVSAPESAWAPHYNRARVTGLGGGTDVAIVMNSTGDFSVKGFTFDGRATANMVAKVGGQALRLVAAAYGAPIPGAQAATLGAPAATGSVADNSVIQNQAAITAAAAEEAQYRAALFRVADSVLANRNGLINGDVSAAAAAAASLVHLQAWRPVAPAAAGTPAP